MKYETRKHNHKGKEVIMYGYVRFVSVPPF